MKQRLLAISVFFFWSGATDQENQSALKGEVKDQFQAQSWFFIDIEK